MEEWTRHRHGCSQLGSLGLTPQEAEELREPQEGASPIQEGQGAESLQASMTREGQGGSWPWKWQSRDRGGLCVGAGRGLPEGKGCHQLLEAHHSLSPPRTLTQDDPGDNQITLEEITQMVSQACPLARWPSLSFHGHLAPRTPPPRPPSGAQSSPVLVPGAPLTKSPGMGHLKQQHFHLA